MSHRLFFTSLELTERLLSYLSSLSISCLSNQLNANWLEMQAANAAWQMMADTAMEHEPS